MKNKEIQLQYRILFQEIYLWKEWNMKKLILKERSNDQFVKLIKIFLFNSYQKKI